MSDPVQPGQEPGATEPAPVASAPAAFDTPAMVPPSEVEAAPGQEGDTAPNQGEVRHVDTSGDYQAPAEGDSVEAGHVSEVVNTDPGAPTAGELRSAGYTVDPNVPDDQVPTRVVVDSPTPYGEIREVLIPQPTPAQRMTPMQFMDQQSGSESTPASEPAPAGGDSPMTTPKEGGGAGPEQVQTKEGGTVSGTP